MNCIRYLAAANPAEVTTASHIPSPISTHSTGSSHSLVDRRTTATLSLPNSVLATITCDLGVPFYLGLLPTMPQVKVTVECEGGEVELFNFVLPTLYHWIRVSIRDGARGGRRHRIEKVYKFQAGKGKGEDWWTTYRYQLEAFVDKIRGRNPQTWITPEDSISNMEWIERVYAKVRVVQWQYTQRAFDPRVPADRPREQASVDFRFRKVGVTLSLRFNFRLVHSAWALPSLEVDKNQLA